MHMYLLIHLHIFVRFCPSLHQEVWSNTMLIEFVNFNPLLDRMLHFFWQEYCRHLHSHNVSYFNTPF